MMGNERFHYESLKRNKQLDKSDITGGTEPSAAGENPGLSEGAAG